MYISTFLLIPISSQIKVIFVDQPGNYQEKQYNLPYYYGIILLVY